MTSPFHDLLPGLAEAAGVPNALDAIDPSSTGEVATGRSLTAAFLITLRGADDARFDEASALLRRAAALAHWAPVASFFERAAHLAAAEMGAAARSAGFVDRLERLAASLEAPAHRGRAAEASWAVFCPEAAGISAQRERRIEELRDRRIVSVVGPVADPITDPVAEILFTANALLTLPPPHRPLDDLHTSAWLKRRLAAIAGEPQRHWYDHPLQVGTDREANEVVYGLEGLDRAVAFEKRRGTVHRNARVTCALSVSTTHDGLTGLARPYLREVLATGPPLRHLDVRLFTEADTAHIIEEILAPAADRYGTGDGSTLAEVFGVSGAYGRHYSFLKALSALWSVLVDPRVRATFKIDLDQVFPQQVLVDETGASAFEHLCNPLWGAEATDAAGRAIDLGMLAGTLVNERDISRSLFTPDVPFPDEPTGPADWVFFSRLPQALSTEAEMMTRYGPPGPDGEHTALERIHVTGGTTGIRVDALRRYRPFTPTFVGRAEDQAYVLASLAGTGSRLGYLHASGLVMRHDKEAFADDAMEAARIDKLVGDHVRILVFSAYARALGNLDGIKAIADPFTGCFISPIPVTVTALRFALTAAGMFDHAPDDALAFLREGGRRLGETLELTGDGRLAARYALERDAWDCFYETLDRLDQDLAAGGRFAHRLRRRARVLVDAASLKSR